MSKLAPAHALPAAESPTQGHTADAAAAADGLTSIVIKTRKPLRLPTFEQQRALGVISDGRPAETWLGVPIIAGDEVIGVISLESVQQHAFSDADARLLTTLTASMGVALENARLFEAERQRAAELETINRIGQALSAQLELGALIDLIGDKMRETFAAQNVYVALYDRANRQLDFAYDLDAGQRLGRLHRSSFGEGLTSPDHPDAPAAADQSKATHRAARCAPASRRSARRSRARSWACRSSPARRRSA